MRFRSFLRFFRLPGSKRRPARHQRRPLHVEHLEKRELLTNDTPFIVFSQCVPLDGSATSSAHPTIQVKYSEAMDSVSATKAANYKLVDSSGNVITIDNVSLDAATSTVATIDYNDGQDLIVDNYTLFVRGDQVFDADDARPLAQPGQLIVANGGQNNVAVAGLPGDGTIQALGQYGLSKVGAQNPNPYAVAFGDLDGDTLPDLVVVNAGTQQAAIFQGQLAIDGGGFSLTPDLVLDLPAGTAN